MHDARRGDLSGNNQRHRISGWQSAGDAASGAGLVTKRGACALLDLWTDCKSDEMNLLNFAYISNNIFFADQREYTCTLQFHPNVGTHFT
jgi:hypothetical protein